MEKSNTGSAKVSIITPLYNSERFIEETAKSVISQTYKDFEWIIINDCSTDNSLSLLENLANKDNRIKIYSLKKNGGPIVSRNKALDEAKGKYIAFLDSDDLWLPEKLEKQIAFMENSNIALTYKEYKKININSELKTGIKIRVPKRVYYNDILKSDSIMASSAIYNMQITGPIRQSFDAPVGKDDFHFFLQILKKNGPAYAINEDLARLRIYGDSITGNKFVSAKLQWKFYRKIIGLSFFPSLINFLVYSVKGFLKYLL